MEQRDTLEFEKGKKFLRILARGSVGKRESEAGSLAPFLYYLVLFSSYHTIAGSLCSLHSPSRIASNLLLKT